MSLGPFTRIATPAAADIAAKVELDEPARALLSDGVTPAEFVERLLAAEHRLDAVRFLAAALPPRQAVWWACLCARSVVDATGPDDTPAPVAAALAAAEAWVFKPSEETRRDAFAKAEATDMGHPAAWAAMAAFWSGGSLAPEGLAEVPPAETLSGQAVATAIQMAASGHQPPAVADWLATYLDQGIDIANGGDGRIRQSRARLS